MHRIVVLVVCLFLPLTAYAQAPAAAEPFRITDNSFLVEEALNQERGIFQNIFGALRINDDWAAAFTQEWPLGGQAHQLSYTVSWLQADPLAGFGDTLINYRYQATAEGPGVPAFSPRISLVLPSGNSRRGLGSGSVGMQINFPLSKQTGDWYWHGNAGMTWLPRARGEGDRRDDVSSTFLAGSAIYRLRPMLNLMLESVLSYDEFVADIDTDRERAFTLSPGLRGGWDVGDAQIVVGIAFPTTWRAGDNATGVFTYFSYELPFLK